MSADSIIKFKKYLESKKYSNYTISSYSFGVKFFLSYLETVHVSIDKICKSDIYLYKEYISDKYAYQGINSKIYSVLSYLEFLNLKLDLDSKVLEFKKTKRKDFVIVDDDLFNRIIGLIIKENRKSLVGLRDLVIFELFYYTGIKINDLVKLRRGDVVDETLFFDGKEIVLNPKLVSTLNEYLQLRTDNEDALIINFSPGKAGLSNRFLSLRSVENIFARYCHLIGRNITIIDLRNSYFANLKNIQVAIASVHFHEELKFSGEFLELIDK